MWCYCSCLFSGLVFSLLLGVGVWLGLFGLVFCVVLYLVACCDWYLLFLVV